MKQLFLIKKNKNDVSFYQLPNQVFDKKMFKIFLARKLETSYERN